MEQFVQKTRKLHKTTSPVSFKIHMITNSIRAYYLPFLICKGVLTMDFLAFFWRTVIDQP